jgi:hypothetical protein
MRWRNVILVALMAALTFGGTFTCESKTRSREFTGGVSQ